MNKPVIGLALGSGAARGWSHIGVLEELEAAGIKPDIVTGCSIGAFVGAAYVSGSLDALRDWALSLRWHEVARLFDVSLNGGGLIEGGEILALMDKLGISGPIETKDMSFAAVATDYRTGREEWLSTGELKDAVRASIALPGIIAPKQIGEHWFVDGGLVNPVPVSVCRAMGATFTIAVNLNGDLIGHNKPPERKNSKSGISEMLDTSLRALPASWRAGTVKSLSAFLEPKPKKPSYFDILANSINIMQDKITRSRLAGEPPHVLMNPRLGAMGIFDFDDAEIAIEEGRRCARHALSEIQYQMKLLGVSD